MVKVKCQSCGAFGERFSTHGITSRKVHIIHNSRTKITNNGNKLIYVCRHKGTRRLSPPPFDKRTNKRRDGFVMERPKR